MRRWISGSFVLLIASGVMGCIPFPGFGRASVFTPDFRPLVGELSSSAPIRPRFATRESVVKLLGKPDQEWAEATSIEWSQ